MAKRIGDMREARRLSEVLYCVRNHLRICRWLLMDIESYVESAEASLFGRSLRLAIWIYPHIKYYNVYFRNT